MASFWTGGSTEHDRVVAFGLIVGIVARLVVPGRQHLSLGMTLVLGLVGSVIGGVVANALGTGDIFELNVLGRSWPSQRQSS
jgi:uncharacterized membrane protein YeaQ/YmgE (transglycosylase-associated protein family)